MNEMAGACSTRRRMEKYTEQGVGNPEGNGPIGTPGRRWEDIIMKNTVLWVVQPCSLFRRNISPPSSGSVSTPRNKAAETGGKLSLACSLLLLVSCFDL
jgi:hypothetical protein